MGSLKWWNIAVKSVAWVLVLRDEKKNKNIFQGNQKVSQRMMRARVAFQGLTVATMLASSMFVLKEKTAAAEEAPARK